MVDKNRSTYLYLFDFVFLDIALKSFRFRKEYKKSEATEQDEVHSKASKILQTLSLSFLLINKFLHPRLRPCVI